MVLGDGARRAGLDLIAKSMGPVGEVTGVVVVRRTESGADLVIAGSVGKGVRKLAGDRDVIVHFAQIRAVGCPLGDFDPASVIVSLDLKRIGWCAAPSIVAIWISGQEGSLNIVDLHCLAIFVGAVPCARAIPRTGFLACLRASPTPGMIVVGVRRGRRIVDRDRHAPGGNGYRPVEMEDLSCDRPVVVMVGPVATLIAIGGCSEQSGQVIAGERPDPRGISVVVPVVAGEFEVSRNAADTCTMIEGVDCSAIVV